MSSAGPESTSARVGAPPSETGPRHHVCGAPGQEVLHVFVLLAAGLRGRVHDQPSHASMPALPTSTMSNSIAPHPFAGRPQSWAAELGRGRVGQDRGGSRVRRLLRRPRGPAGLHLGSPAAAPVPPSAGYRPRDRRRRFPRGERCRRPRHARRTPPVADAQRAAPIFCSGGCGGGRGARVPVPQRAVRFRRNRVERCYCIRSIRRRS